MSLSPKLHDVLAASLADALSQAEPGHCLRVDHLDQADALRLCDRLRELQPAGSVACYVLASTSAAADPFILAEKAIELRNRKQHRLCLLVPAGLGDSAASSLTNAFAAFDLAGCWQRVAENLRATLPEEVRRTVARVREQLRGAADVAPEAWADYLGAVAEQPSAETAGLELWRVGLLPDTNAEVNDQGMVDRLADNRRCLGELVRPVRAQSPLAERVERLNLMPGPVRERLVSFLNGRRLRDSAGWLHELAVEHRDLLTFERWEFAHVPTDLEAILVADLVDKSGTVVARSGFEQPSGPNTQPHAPVGGRVRVRWVATPKKPQNVQRWQLSLIPSREEYPDGDAGDADLPQLSVAVSTLTATLPLELDLGTVGVNPVQVRVVGLDPYGSEVRDGGGCVVEGLSQEFWLAQAAGEIGELEGHGRRATVTSLPLARLRAARELDGNTLEPSGGAWSTSGQAYFSLTFNGRLTARLGLSTILKAVEERALAEPASGGRYRAHVDAADTLDAGTLQPVGLPELSSSEAGLAFLRQRDRLFKALRRDAGRALVETVDWTPELSRAARAYAESWRTLVSSADSPARGAEALTVDTVELALEQTQGTEVGLLLLPTHPLRMLWYAAYAELLLHWEEQLLAQSKRDRIELLDLDLAERIAPLNCPMLVPGFDGLELYLFAHNLGFLWAAALPVGTRDPARQLADLTRVVGLPDDAATLTDLTPRRLAHELEAYRGVHPYLETLRLNLINPGNGVFVAEALREFCSAGVEDEDAADVLPPPRLELLAHAPTPLPLALPALADLQRQLYEVQPKGRRHHLAPLCVMALRPLEQTDCLPGGDVNLAVQVDSLCPQVRGSAPSDATADSSSLYGLLVRLVPEFHLDQEGAHWLHRIALPEVHRERHPRQGWYTADLVETHRAALRAVGRLLSPQAADPLPAVVASLGADEQAMLERVHQQADWVVTLDRFLGVEFFDHPEHTALAGVARKYLLDYVPEFLDGLGHRMLVTTSHRDEIGEVLGRAMRDLGFEAIDDSVGAVLDHLKTVSGRLALRVVGDDARAREAVGLGAVVAWLRARGELRDVIVVPVDAHPDLFHPAHRRRRSGRAVARAERCDLILVRFNNRRLEATLIEVKTRSQNQPSAGLMATIADQIESTAAVLTDLFFSQPQPTLESAKAVPRRIDHVLQRSRLATLLRFYLRRAQRHGLISSADAFAELDQGIARLESGIPELKLHRRGYLINLAGLPQPPAQQGPVEIVFLTAQDFSTAGLSVTSEPSGPAPAAVPDAAASSHSEGTASGGETPGSERGVDLEDLRAAAQVAPPERGAGDAEAPTPGGPLEVAVELGTTVGDQEAVTWRASVKGSPHLFVLGIPGQGKSVTSTRLVCEMAEQGLPSLILDFHGQFADPEGLYARLARPRVLRVGDGLPFSPFEAEVDDGPSGLGWKTSSYRIAEIFGYVCNLGDIQRDLVYQSLEACYRDLGFAGGQPERLPTIRELVQQLAEHEGRSGTRNVLARCRPLLEFGLFRDVIQTEPLDLLALVGSGLVLDVSQVELEEVQLAGGSFLLRKVYRDMFRWGESDRLRLAIVLDEAHRLTRDTTLPRIMKEGRKFGVAVVAASQNLNDFHDDVVGNAGTKVIFKMNHPESKRAAGLLRSRQVGVLVDTLEGLPVGQAYVQTPDNPQAVRTAMHAAGCPM